MISPVVCAGKYNRGMAGSLQSIASANDRGDPFGSTRWSVVLKAGSADREGKAALESLCRTYWMPAYLYVRRRTASTHDAEELTQEFFASLLERDAIARADPARGRFRAFLVTALKHFLTNEAARASAQKRGGRRRPLAMDIRLAEDQFASAGRAMTAEQEFERRWAVAALEQALARLASEESAAGRVRLFETLRPFLSGQNESSAAEAGQELGISEQAVRAAVYRLRKRFRAALREEIRATVDSADEVEDELRRLFQALGG